jgi:Rps23 Pro-64 3,4-dihydroxylase Tpa1-like proline 4-hydroxylase
MESQELAPGIVVYKNAIPGSENLWKDIEDGATNGLVSWHSASVKTGDKTGTDNEIRNTDIMAIPYFKNQVPDGLSPSTDFLFLLNKLFYDSFTPIEKNYSDSFGIAYNNHDSWDILKYGVGQKFTNHIDDHQDYHRRISLVYYMNDDYLGGEIIFPRFGIRYKPKANELLIFPSTYTYNHSVVPVTSGTRYAVVSWIC